MYSRTYSSEDTELKIPENYDGTAFSENVQKENVSSPKIESAKMEVKRSPSDAPEEIEEVFLNEKREKEKFLGIDFGGLFGGLFGKGFSLKSFIPERIGTEEILIIGIALFLIFSKSKDIECALMLLALIFIK